MKNSLALTSLALMTTALLVGCGGNGGLTPTQDSSKGSATATVSEATAPDESTGDQASASSEIASAETPGEVQPEAMGSRGGSSLALIKIAPATFSWGQGVQVGWKVTVNGQPMKNASVRFWLSGQKGRKSGSWYSTTGANGETYKTMTLPRDKDYYKWLDLNATVDKYGLTFFKSHIVG